MYQSCYGIKSKASEKYVNQIINLIKQEIALSEEQLQLVKKEINTYTLDELEQVYAKFKRYGVKNYLNIFYLCCAMFLLK